MVVVSIGEAVLPAVIPPAVPAGGGSRGGGQPSTSRVFVIM